MSPPDGTQSSLSFATLDLGADRFRLYQADAVEWLRSLPDASIDLIVTDPAYESLEKHRAKGTTTRLKHSKSSSNDWFPIFPNERFPEFFRECFRVLKKDRHFYLFCDPETMFVVKPIAETAGFKFWKPLVWWKVLIGMGYHYRSSYEFVLFFEKGKRQLVDLGIPDVIAQRLIRKGWPTQKPAEVARLLTYQSAPKDGIVCDPFMGSGSFGVAALHQDCRFVGCDISEKAVTLARSRLEPLEDCDRFEQPEDPPDGTPGMVTAADEDELHEPRGSHQADPKRTKAERAKPRICPKCKSAWWDVPKEKS